MHDLAVEPVGIHGVAASFDICQPQGPEVQRVRVRGLFGQGPSPISEIMAAMTGFQRFQTKYVGRTGAPVGVLVAVDHLRRTGRLLEKEITCYAVADAWFQENLPNPPFYADGNSIGAITWFRESADSMTARLDPLLAILDAKKVAWERLSTSDPGRIVYQDLWQVGVLPAFREPMTPLPYPGKLGANDWFTVRKSYL